MLPNRIDWSETGIIMNAIIDIHEINNFVPETDDSTASDNHECNNFVELRLGAMRPRFGTRGGALITAVFAPRIEVPAIAGAAGFDPS
jgi:hypothetical protein